ncbi:hypothetical protein LDENG_00131500 [Lucifuga dentata]|nr:hypothetical protein LDENG_00131500 [Lucifuga dentata]
MNYDVRLYFRPQNIELGATGGASKQDGSNMADMTVEDITMRANQVTDESLESTRRMLQMAEEVPPFLLSSHWKALGGCCRWPRRADRLV